MTAEPPALDAAAILANARALTPRLAARADDIERGRRIPDDLLAALTEAGVFRMAMPRSWGGPEMTPVEQVEVLEALGRGDASTAWVVSILSDSGYYSGFLAEAPARELFPRLDMKTAGMVAPGGTAEIVEGGYRVSGRWSFGSGCLHADHIVGGCLLTRGGATIPGEGGLPDWRVLFLPRERVHIHDTWFTTGLRGTASNDYSVEDVFVPEGHAFWPLGRPQRPGPLYGYHGLFFANVPGVALGAAQHALDEVAAIGERKISMPEMQPLRQQYRLQVAAAEAEGLVGAARAYVHTVLNDVWGTLCAGGAPTLQQRARVGLMLVHCMQACRQAVRLLCDEVGTTPIFASSPLERISRDVATMATHLIGQRRTYQPIGRVLLGVDTPVTFF